MERLALVLAAEPLYPMTSGHRIAAVHHVRAVAAAGFHTHVVGFAKSSRELDLARAEVPGGLGMHLTLQRFSISAALRVLRGAPYAVATRSDPGALAELLPLVRAYGESVVIIVEGLYALGPWLWLRRTFPGIGLRTCYIVQNIERRVYDGRVHLDIGALRGLARALDARLIWRFERTLLEANPFGMVACLSMDESAYLRATYPSLPVVDCPPYVPALTSSQEVLHLDFSDRPFVLFVGKLDYEPNVRGLRWFLEAVWPQVRSQMPDAEFVVVGKNEAIVAKLAERSARVRAIAEVPSVSAYLAHASCIVAPLLNGGGMKLKVLQEIGAGRAIVATNNAVLGLPQEMIRG